MNGKVASTLFCTSLPCFLHPALPGMVFGIMSGNENLFPVSNLTEILYFRYPLRYDDERLHLEQGSSDNEYC
jgi:hypothetical protein